MGSLKNYLLVFSSLLIFNMTNGQNQSPQFNQLIHQKVEVREQSSHDIKANKTRSDIQVVSMRDQLCFPYDISTDGKHVVIAKFSTEPVDYWHVENGTITLDQGTGYGISDDGKIAGTFAVNVMGTDINVAGYWEPESQEWTFLGENPNYPGFGTITEYNSGWDITADGETVVGLQWDNSWGAYAMLWNQSFGYTDLGGSTYPSNSSRASGISKDGSLIYGWTQGAQWNPTVWVNNEINILSTSGGETTGASPEGTYAVGITYETSPNGSNICFIWHKDDGTMEMIENTLNNDGQFNLIGILEDKTCFGYTNDNFPPLPPYRRACIIDSDGVMQTFNDYAEARGLVDAQDWLFYSVNAATPDGNIFIGTAQTPEGLDIGFYIDFSTEAPLYNLNLNMEPEGSATLDGAGEYEAGAEVNISAEPIGYYEFDNWTNEEGEIVSEDAEATIIMPDSDYTLIANFHSTVGLSNTSLSKIKFYPNPVKNVLNLEGLMENSIVEIVNPTGAIVYNTKTNDQNTQVDLSGLSSGIYILRVIHEDQLIISRKVTVI